jgi:uncharacterized protein YggE
VTEQVTVSVRGEAERAVAPDFVTMRCTLSTRAPSKVDALGQLRVVQRALVDALAALGGVPLTVQTRQASVTWSLGSIGTSDEHDFDKATGHHGPTGWVVAEGVAVITARALGRVNELGQVLASVRGMHIDHISWQVDQENEQWRGVRSDAIDAALAKGRDYAAALGGAVTRVEQIADAGLLSPQSDGTLGRRSADVAMSLAGTAEGGADLATLDPVPQVIRAVVEARLTAEVEPLSAGDT